MRFPPATRLVGGRPPLAAAAGAWRGGDDGWRQTGTFGSTDGTGVPMVRSLVADGDRIVAVTTTGATWRLWYSTDGSRSWQELTAPTATPAGADQVTVAAAGGGQLLILVDDASSVRAWRWWLDQPRSAPPGRPHASTRRSVRRTTAPARGGA